MTLDSTYVSSDITVLYNLFYFTVYYTRCDINRIYKLMNYHLLFFYEK